MSQETTREELHRQFNELVAKMIDNGCDLPDNMTLYHYVHKHIGRDNQTLSIRSFLTPEAANASLKMWTEPCHQVSRYDSFCVARGTQPFDIDTEHLRHYYNG